MKKIITIAAIISMISIPALALTNFSGELDGKPQIILSGGSDTTYALHNAVDRIYNEAPGCVNTITTAATSDLGKCLINGTTPVLPPSFSDLYTNVQHDTVVQLYPVGSSNGIKQLLDGGITDGVPALDLARSSRALKTGNETKYLNSTAFAADGISWFHFTKVNKITTKHATVTNLTMQQLAAIYKGNVKSWNELAPNDKVLGVMKAYNKIVNGKSTTIKAGIANGNPETNPALLYVTYVPLKVYFGQDGSGTSSTWHTAMTIGDSSYAGNGKTADADNYIRIMENDASQIPVADAPYAIYFYSYGRYTQRNADQGALNKGYVYGAITGNSTARANWSDALGTINGLKVSSETILSKTFPINRSLFLITKQNPKKTVKAYIRFLCSAEMDTAIGANGQPIRPQINNALKAEGFISLTKAIDGGLDNDPSMSYCRTTVATG